jgi:RNA polymerase sigma-70 factor (ECF subfamily)
MNGQDHSEALSKDCSDDRLMQAFAAGQGAAFEALYRRHEGALFRFVRRVLGQDLAAQADEVFQVTWMKIVGAKDSYAPGAASWKTWAFTIAHHSCLDVLRKSGRELGLGADAAGEDGGPADLLDWLQAELGQHSPSSEDTAHWRAAGQQLMLCLDQLPTAQRVAFLLHHEEGCSLLDMAQSLQIAAEAVKSRLRYAMAKLRGCMAPYLVDMGLAGGKA